MSASKSTGGGSGLVVGVQLLANVAVIAASVCVVWMIIQRLQSGATSGPDIYAVGETVGPIEGVDFTASPRTLIMALREKCPFCQMSIPFYRTLKRRLIDTDARDLQILVVSTDDPDDMSRYLQSNGIKVDQVVRYQAGSLKIPGTPFLFLVDRTGQVKRLWRGKPDSAREGEVLAALGLAE